MKNSAARNTLANVHRRPAHVGIGDGAPGIERVDGDKLVTMFERAGIGLKPKQTYDVDVRFFEEFRT